VRLLPFLVLPLYSSVEKIDWSLAEAASDLGADGLRVFRHAILPQIIPRPRVRAWSWCWCRRRDNS